MEIGEKIKKIRKESNLSQEEFGELFHVTRQAVSHWEHNRNYPDMGTLEKISDKFNISFDELIKGDEELIDKIDKTRIRVSLWKKLFIILGLIMLVLTTVYAMPKAAKYLYYDPEETVAVQHYSDGSVEDKRMDVDMQVFSTLRIPGHKFDNVISYDMGMGCYDITINQSSYVGDKEKSVSGTVERNHLQLFDPNVFKIPYGNVFEWSTYSRDIHKSLEENIANDQEEWERETHADGFTLPEAQGIAGDTEDSKDALKELAPDKYYEAYISFHNAMDYKDALKWIDDHRAEGLLYPWVAVATGDDIQNGPIGFYTEFSGYLRAFDKEKYPFLFGYEDVYKNNGEDELRNEANAQQHMLSMLRYMQDQKTFWKMMSDAGFDSNFNEECLESTIDYIEKNGLKIYGVAITAKKDTLIKIHEDKEVFSIGTEAYND